MVEACLSDLGLEAAGVTLRQTPFNSLPALSAPFVLLLANGNGIIVNAIDTAGFHCGPPDALHVVAASAIESIYAGAVLVPVTAAAAGPAPQQTAPLADAEASSPQQPASPPVDVRRWTLQRIIRSRHFLPLMFVSALTNIFVFALPAYSMIVYDRIIPHQALPTLWAMTIGVTLILLIDLFLRNVRNRLLEAVSVATSLSIQDALVQRLMRAAMGTADRAPSVAAQAVSGIEGAALAMPPLLVGLSVDLPFVLAALAYLVWTSGLASLVPITVILGIVGVTFISHVRTKAVYAAAAQANIRKNVLLEESLGSLDTVKTTGTIDRTAATWAVLNDEAAYQSHLSRMAAGSTAQWVNALSQFSTVGLLCAGVLIIAQNAMTVGTLVATVLLAGRLLTPVSILAATISRYFSLDSSLKQADRLLSLPMEATGDTGRQTGPAEGHIQFVRTLVSYGDALAPALNAVSFTVPAGQHVGIIGRVGSGKSTIAKLVTRLVEPKSGSVLVDHYDVRQYSPDALRSGIAYMSQDCDLFDTTLRDNIVRGLHRIDEALFERVVRATGVYDIAARNPEGFGMRVGPGGRNLSGGERQAVCLARTLCRPAPIVLLDEPTAAMDNQLERLVIDRVKPLLAGRTTIVITHRAPALALVDRVVWLEGGNKIADGPTKEIVARAGKGTP